MTLCSFANSLSESVTDCGNLIFKRPYFQGAVPVHHGPQRCKYTCMPDEAISSANAFAAVTCELCCDRNSITLLTMRIRSDSDALPIYRINIPFYHILQAVFPSPFIWGHPKILNLTSHDSHLLESHHSKESQIFDVVKFFFNTGSDDRIVPSPVTDMNSCIVTSFPTSTSKSSSTTTGQNRAVWNFR